MAATELAADAVAKALEAVAEGRSPPASPMTMNPLHIEEGGTSGSVSERVSRRLRGVSVEDLKSSLRHAPVWLQVAVVATVLTVLETSEPRLLLKPL